MRLRSPSWLRRQQERMFSVVYICVLKRNCNPTLPTSNRNVSADGTYVTQSAFSVVKSKNEVAAEASVSLRTLLLEVCSTLAHPPTPTSWAAHPLYCREISLSHAHLLYCREISLWPPR